MIDTVSVFPQEFSGGRRRKRYDPRAARPACCCFSHIAGYSRREKPRARHDQRAEAGGSQGCCHDAAGSHPPSFSTRSLMPARSCATRRLHCSRSRIGWTIPSCRPSSCSAAAQGGSVITGTGKSADVGQKIAGTLNSTGTRAYVLDATRAVHGDLGMVHPRRRRPGPVAQRRERRNRPPARRRCGQLALGLVALTGNAAQHPGPQRGRCPRPTARWKKSARSAWRPAPAPRP